MIEFQRALLKASWKVSRDSEGREYGKIDSQEERGWSRRIVPFLMVAVTSFPLAIPLTLRFQLPGSLLGFFLTGFAGGYLAGPSRSKGLNVGLVGSTFACLIGIVFLVAVMS